MYDTKTRKTLAVAGPLASAIALAACGGGGGGGTLCRLRLRQLSLQPGSYLVC